MVKTPQRRSHSGPKSPEEVIAKHPGQSTGVRRNCAWTEAEHLLFLLGLEEHGRGAWRAIASEYVLSRTATQVASHAQKYFLREGLPPSKREKKRPSIHDVRCDQTTSKDDRSQLCHTLQQINRASMESNDTYSMDAHTSGGYKTVTDAMTGKPDTNSSGDGSASVPSALSPPRSRRWSLDNSLPSTAQTQKRNTSLPQVPRMADIYEPSPMPASQPAQLGSNSSAMHFPDPVKLESCAEGVMQPPTRAALEQRRPPTENFHNSFAQNHLWRPQQQPEWQCLSLPQDCGPAGGVHDPVLDSLLDRPERVQQVQQRKEYPSFMSYSRFHGDPALNGGIEMMPTRPSQDYQVSYQGLSRSLPTMQSSYMPSQPLGVMGNGYDERAWKMYNEPAWGAVSGGMEFMDEQWQPTSRPGLQDVGLGNISQETDMDELLECMQPDMDTDCLW